MDDREDIEAWADALLDQHRTAPPRPKNDTEALIEELPVTMRYLIKSGQPPDPHMIERLHRSTKRARHFDNAQGVITLVGMIALGVFLFSIYSTF